MTASGNGPSEAEEHVRVLESWRDSDLAWLADYVKEIADNLSRHTDHINELTDVIRAQQTVLQTYVEMQRELMQAVTALVGRMPVPTSGSKAKP